MVKSRKNFIIMLMFIVFSAVAARFIIGVLYYNSYDTFWYRDWAFGLQDGLFDIYSRAEEISLDYPPLYLFCLYLTGMAYRVFGAGCGDALQMILMKFWPILFDGLCIILIWRMARPHGEWTALFAAAAWAYNPSVFYNTACWGQTDQLMAFLLLAAFFLADRNRPVLACVTFAVAGLTKYQSLFFTPVLLLYIFRSCGWKPTLKGVLAAAGTVLAVFLPFMIGARDPLLFFRVYLGGAATYKYCTFNAYNFYGMFGLNAVRDDTTIFGAFSYAHLNLIFVLLIIAYTAYLFLRGRKINIYVGGLFIMEALFMLATRMHERYQMVVLPFALMAYVTTRNRHFIYQFSLLTLTTFVNQFVILAEVRNSDIFFAPYMGEIMWFFSVINFAVFLYVSYVCTYYIMDKEKAV